jgi:hypothetical protein
MKIVAAVFADFVERNIGGPSALLEDLAGVPVIVRTLRRVAAIEGLAARCLFVRPRDRDVAARALQDAGVMDRFELVAEDRGQRPKRELFQAGRRWRLDGWRSTPLGLTYIDEFVNPPMTALLMQRYECDALFCFDGAQPALDVGIAGEMLAHLDRFANEVHLVFTQAPPGLAGVLLKIGMIRDMLSCGSHVGLHLTYHPMAPVMDPITHPSCYHVSPDVSQTTGRFTGDTRRSRELLAAAWDALGAEADAEALCGWLRDPAHARAGPLPVEVELELTTADPLPETTLRPRGQRVPTRQVEDLEAVRRLAAELATYDDRLVYLGGFGDPLQHPQFGRICEILRSAGVFGLAAGTHLLDAPAESVDALFSNAVDVLEIRLDAHTAETYARVHGRAGFKQAVNCVSQLEARRRAESLPRPLLVCSQTRCAETFGDLEPFHDHWLQQVGSAVIEGRNTYCGTFPEDTLLPARPPKRTPCRRLQSRLMLLADGAAVSCSQDFEGRQAVGNWIQKSLGEIWRGEALESLRRRQAELVLGEDPLCGSCGEWHRL